MEGESARTRLLYVLNVAECGDFSCHCLQIGHFVDLTSSMTTDNSPILDHKRSRQLHGIPFHTSLSEAPLESLRATPHHFQRQERCCRRFTQLEGTV